MATVVTGFSPSGYEEYGRQFLQTFEMFWPDSVRLFAFIENEPADIDVVSRAQFRSLWDCEGLREFLDRHKHNATAAGRGPNQNWAEKYRNKDYCYRYDARKFAKQMFPPEAAAKELPDGEILIWLDGDVITTAPVPDGLAENLLGDSDVSYLGRRGTHSEIGYWSVRLNQGTRDFLSWLAGSYRTDAVFNMREWHSAFVWDRCRERFEKKGGKAKNLTPSGHGHVWFSCKPLADVSDHLKGRRKALGRSPERQ